MVPVAFRVQRVQRETPDSVTLELVSANGSGGVFFAPGQFNMVYVFGVGEVPMSITGNPARADTLVHTTRSVGTVSSGVSPERMRICPSKPRSAGRAERTACAVPSCSF